MRETLAPNLGGRDVVVDMDIPSSAMSEGLRHAALCIMREAAVNAVRHGKAGTVAVSGELDGRRLTFSVVDDGRGFDPKNVREGFIRLIDREEGLEIVAEAENGLEAVRLAAELSPDLTILDLRMPKMDGAAAASKILEANPGAKILLLTSFAKAAEVKTALDAGVIGAVVKDILRLASKGFNLWIAMWSCPIGPAS